jgi:hypothetical protein
VFETVSSHQIPPLGWYLSENLSISRKLVSSVQSRAEHHDLWDFWTRVLATWVATGHYHAETTAGMLMVVGETVSEP